jgi:citrate lyase synthetase
MEFYMTSLTKMKMTMRRLNGIVLNANVATKVKIARVSTAQQKCRMR